MESEPRAEARDKQDVTEEAAPATEEAAPAVAEAVPPAAAADEETLAGEVTDAPTEPDPATEVAELKQAVQERTNDLKRLQAEYVNYKRRVDRDRDVARNAGIEAVIVDLTGLLDTLRLAQEHEEMTGGFKLLVEELEKITAKYGLQTFGEKGEPFDPQVHDALMQSPMPGVTEPTVADVMQIGYRFRGRVLRPARVAVGMPTEEAPAPSTQAPAAADDAAGGPPPA